MTKVNMFSFFKNIKTQLPPREVLVEEIQKALIPERNQLMPAFIGATTACAVSLSGLGLFAGIGSGILLQGQIKKWRRLPDGIVYAPFFPFILATLINPLMNKDFPTAIHNALVLMGVCSAIGAVVFGIADIVHPNQPNPIPQTHRR